MIEYNALKLASWNGGNEDLERFQRNIGRVEKDAEKQPAKAKPLPPPRNKPPVPARRRSEATVDKAAEDNEKAQVKPAGWETQCMLPVGREFCTSV